MPKYHHFLIKTICLRLFVILAVAALILTVPDNSNPFWLKAIFTVAFGGIMSWEVGLLLPTIFGKPVGYLQFEEKLPKKFSLSIEVPSPCEVTIILYFTEVSPKRIHGSMDLYTLDRRKLIEHREYTEPKGHIIRKAFTGEEQRVLGRAARGIWRAPIIFRLIAATNANCVLDLDVDWNFRNWNSSLERAIPKNEVLKGELIVQIVRT